ncbi:hypothetical protein WJU16_02870 [Chitinophaga pollutisoli]|uniref:Uncharacterized protein n=1 Tax=Chitinophaga pollutisoli TaxID=3133966 RepID=A0ABZ2YRM5_9BACT
MAKSFSLDEAMERLQHYHNAMEKVQPGYLKSKSRDILDRNFLEYLRKHSGQDVEGWLLDNALKFGAEYANKKVNTSRGERFARQVQLGGKGLVQASFRLGFQLVRLLAQSTRYLIAASIPHNILAFFRNPLGTATTANKPTVSEGAALSNQNQQPTAQSQQTTADGKLSQTVVQPNGQLQTAPTPQQTVVPQPAAVTTTPAAAIHLPPAKSKKPATSKKAEQVKAGNNRQSTRRKQPPAGQRKGPSR